MNKLYYGRVMTLGTSYEQYRMHREEVLQLIGNGVSAYNRSGAPLDCVRNSPPPFRYP